MKKLFLLEDDQSLITGLTFAFQKQGFELDAARTLAEADALWADRKDKYDLLVLDVTLPDGSGFDFCQKVRSTSNVPILFLTASDEEMNIIMGLDMGGDDYLTKPFKLAVLLSRVNALLRRAGTFRTAGTDGAADRTYAVSGISAAGGTGGASGAGASCAISRAGTASEAGAAPTTDAELTSNGITVRLLQSQAYKNGALLELTATEYRLLCLFMRNPNTVLTKEQLLGRLWDCDENYIDSSALTVYIRRLRMKIEDNPGKPKMLLTARGLGYKWSATP